MMRMTMLVALATTMGATPAITQDKGEELSPTAYKAMAAGDYDAAERKLRETAREDVGARINLAQIFADTGREREALVLLRSVLDNDDIALEGIEGDILSSHRVATVLLQRMGSPERMATAGR